MIGIHSLSFHVFDEYYNDNQPFCLEECACTSCTTSSSNCTTTTTTTTTTTKKPCKDKKKTKKCEKLKNKGNVARRKSGRNAKRLATNVKISSHNSKYSFLNCNIF